MGWTLVLWVLALAWSVAAILCEVLPGVSHSPDHAQLMAGLFLVGAVISGKLDVRP